MSQGAVFQLHAEAKDKWREWETGYEPRKEAPPEERRREEEKEESAKVEEPTEAEEPATGEEPTAAPAQEEKKRGGLRGLFRRDD